MVTTTCQDHAVKFMATEQHLLIEIYGYFKQLQKGQMIALLINKRKKKAAKRLALNRMHK